MIGSAELARLAVETGLNQAAVELVMLDEPWSAVACGRELTIYPASMIKTPIAVAAAVAVGTGRASWDERVPVNLANMTVNDAPSPLAPGASASLLELVALMLSRSDNVATNVLIDRLGRDRASADIASLGLTATHVRRKLSGSLPLIDDPAASGRNTHPARDAGELFRRIARRTVPGAEPIARALAAQYWNTKLSAGLEPADRFAHKTGDTDDVSHDGGILTLADGQRYVLVVYAQLPSNAETDARFAAFMRALRPSLGRFGRPAKR